VQLILDRPDAGPAADRILVDAARAGSHIAFETLVDRYRAPVVRLAYRLTHDADEAKDIAQDSFLRAYRRLGDFHPDRPFARWLFVIARNASLDAIRRRRRAATLVTNEGNVVLEPGPEEIALRNDEALRVHAALEALPPNYRDVLELYYLTGLRYREIAVELEIPIGTVKTYISRAKRRLREELDVPEALAA
jgi:RNA polymerase sigma-70 factor (ECF subfamily)